MLWQQQTQKGFGHKSRPMQVQVQVNPIVFSGAAYSQDCSQKDQFNMTHCAAAPVGCPLHPSREFHFPEALLGTSVSLPWDKPLPASGSAILLVQICMDLLSQGRAVDSVDATICPVSGLILTPLLTSAAL